MTANYDLLIIGGGVNGTGIAADAAGRGLSVYLCEKDDLASHTSSASSKMIHGGLRYLEYYQFRLVREALAERDVLLSIAPHIVQPLRLIIPHNKLQRPAWLIRLGLFIYDHLGFRWGHKSRLPKSTAVTIKKNRTAFAPLKSSLTTGFAYSDCKVDDARLVVLNAVAAKKHGADINTHTEFLNAKRENNVWTVTLKNSNGEFTLTAKALINAAGPWVDDIVNNRLHIHTKHAIELVKGSHIVFPKFYEGEQAYLLQNTDKRVVFVIPYHDNFTMVGTTDIDYRGDPNQVHIDEAEKIYLCDLVNYYFKQQFSPKDIVNEWSGTRPLQADEANNPSAVTRDYSLEVEDDRGHAPILSIFGGKITTYRRLAEHALSKLKPYFLNMGSVWTATTPLPGGDILQGDLDNFIEQLTQDYPQLPRALLTRWAMAYGTRIDLIANKNASVADLGELFTSDLYQAEVDYLIKHEWARSTEDILWRRSKLGLYASEKEIDLLFHYLQNIHT